MVAQNYDESVTSMLRFGDDVIRSLQMRKIDFGYSFYACKTGIEMKKGISRSFIPRSCLPRFKLLIIFDCQVNVKAHFKREREQKKKKTT